ncbi:hypothetical protein HD554DRAFT_2020784 [Boletus coccyginus]|nr:hypothetical protein HD554DRAFT_2020784 [Boletus coccyginus]
MNPSAFTVHGSWRRASSSADVDLEAQAITGIHAPFTLPTAVRAPAVPIPTPHGTTTDTIDDLFGVTHPHATHESQHDLYPSLDGHDIPPPPYGANAEPPAYPADSNIEPITLAMYLFKFGFLFPPLWIFGSLILITPLTAPTNFEPSKSETERQELVQIIRDAELRWAKRCAWALVVLLVLGGVVVAVALVALHS